MTHRKGGKVITAAGLLALFTLLAGCSTTPVTVAYNAEGVTRVAQAARNSVVIALVADSRKHDPSWLGAIRSGFGSPLKSLETPVPVKDVVATAYREGLKARGLLADGAGRYEMRIGISRFDCSQYVRREAHAHFLVTVTDRATGAQVYERRVVVDKVVDNANLFDVGIAANVEDLRKVANQALQEAIDETLNDPALIGALT